MSTTTTSTAQLNQIPINSIKAPAYLYIDGEVLFVKDSIKVQKVTARSDLVTSNAIKAGDIVTSQKIEIKATPVAFSNSDVLFDVLSLVKGQRLPTIDDCYIIARTDSNEWVKWTFASAIHDGVGSITFNSEAPLGEHSWSVYPNPLNPTDVLVTSEVLSAKPTLPAMSDLGSFMLRTLAIYGTGDSKVECDTEGASIDISVNTEDAKNDRLSIFGKNLTDIEISPKFKPSNITYANWLKLTGITTVSELGTFNGIGTLPNLVLRGEKSGDFAFTLQSVRLADPSATFGASTELMDELTFTALGDSLGDNKLEIATTTSAFEFYSDEADSDTNTSNNE